jgi:ribosomal protein S18 acetylase RimI-like enzyme
VSLYEYTFIHDFAEFYYIASDPPDIVGSMNPVSARQLAPASQAEHPSSNVLVRVVPGQDRLAAPVLRRFDPRSDAGLIPGITAMLHRAYAKQVSMGLHPLAGRQDDAITLRRCSSGECFLAVDPSASVAGGEVVRGVIILNEIEPDEGPTWFARPGVASFSQLAVDPASQGRGIGRLLLDTVEARAAERGAVELGLSMAEPDADLRRFYQRHGYRIVATWKWPYTNYTSLILSKSLRGGVGAALPKP